MRAIINFILILYKFHLINASQKKQHINPIKLQQQSTLISKTALFLATLSSSFFYASERLSTTLVVVVVVVVDPVECTGFITSIPFVAGTKEGLAVKALNLYSRFSSIYFKY